MVTVTSVVLAILAGWAFVEGAFWPGLAAAWLMTFLDTLDGKLARVTVNSSRLGDVLDHGLDLIHPPLWYLAWGLGLSTWAMVPGLGTTITLLFATYIGGRLCEGGFQLLAPFSLFTWQPFDSCNRLITARRNPNLLLLTASLAVGRPDVGLWLVAAWHTISTLVLLFRVIQALWQNQRGEGLASWLDGVDPVANRDRLVVRLFTQVPPQP
jgi:phosphatidylglycerophosphate synthase